MDNFSVSFQQELMLRAIAAETDINKLKNLTRELAISFIKSKEFITDLMRENLSIKSKSFSTEINVPRGCCCCNQKATIYSADGTGWCISHAPQESLIN